MANIKQTSMAIWFLLRMVSSIDIISKDREKYNLTIHLVAWKNNPPYVYVNVTTGTSEGMVIEHLQYIRNSCLPFYKNISINIHPINSIAQLLKYMKNRQQMLSDINATQDDLIFIFGIHKDPTLKFSESTLVRSNGIGVIARNTDVLLINKLFKGIRSSLPIIYLAVLMAILIAFFISIFESIAEKRSFLSFSRSLPTSIWFTIITMTTVGYGDIVPKHYISRVITLCWIILSLLLTSMVTATVMNEAQNEITVQGEKLATLRNSFEQTRTNSYGGYNVLYNSYEEIFDSVINNEAKAALLDLNVASFYFESHPELFPQVKSLKIIKKLLSFHTIRLFQIDDTIRNRRNIALYAEYSKSFESCEKPITRSQMFTPHQLYLQEKYTRRPSISSYYVRPLTDIFDDSDYGLVRYTSIVVFLLMTLGLGAEFVNKYLQIKEKTTSGTKDDKEENVE